MKNCMKPLSRPGPRRRRPQPVSPNFDRLCQRFPPQEAEDIWDAALSARAAGREECFLRGFRLGALLMLDLLSGGEGERGTKTRSRPL